MRSGLGLRFMILHFKLVCYAMFLETLYLMCSLPFKMIYQVFMLILFTFIITLYHIIVFIWDFNLLHLCVSMLLTHIKVLLKL